MVIKDQDFLFEGSPNRIVQEIGSIQKKNDVYEGDAKIWEYCNEIWCERDPKRCISAGHPSLAVGMRSKVLTFAYALKALVKNGLKPVSQLDADRRGHICSTCPKNRHVETCGSCRATVNLITKSLLGNRKTRYDRKLKGCVICGCDLKQKIHYPLNEDDKNEYPDYCWVSKEQKAEE
jgi:hypothetical protein